MLQFKIDYQSVSLSKRMPVFLGKKKIDCLFKRIKVDSAVTNLIQLSGKGIAGTSLLSVIIQYAGSSK